MRPAAVGRRAALDRRRGADPACQGVEVLPRRVLHVAGTLELTADRGVYALAERKLNYSNPPASFEGYGQKIRTPDLVFSENCATCLDSSVLYASLPAASRGSIARPPRRIEDEQPDRQPRERRHRAQHLEDRVEPAQHPRHGGEAGPAGADERVEILEQVLELAEPGGDDAGAAGSSYPLVSIMTDVRNWKSPRWWPANASAFCASAMIALLS